MRFEAKHRMFKTAANTTSNRRNICMSLAIKHQLQLNDMFLKGTLSNDIEFGPYNNLICNSDVKNIKQFLEINSFDSLFCYSRISVKGTKYQHEMVLTLDINENSLPKFGVIDAIYLCNNRVVVFQCCLLSTIIFDEHFFSYEVYHHMLYSHIPNNISIMSNGCDIKK